MANPEVVKFISEQLAAGHSEADIRTALKAKNWPDSEIDMGFSAWHNNPTLPERKDVGRFIGESWDVFRSLVPRLLVLYGRFFIQSLILVVGAGVPIGIFQVLRNGGQMEADLANILTVVIAILGGIYLFYLMIWLQASLILLVKNRTVEMEVKDVMSSAQSYIWKFFGTSVLMGFLVLLWGLLLIIPAIIFGVYYMLAEYIVMDKNIAGMKAIRMSKEYVKGHWWQVFFSVLGLAAIGLLASWALQALALLAGPKAAPSVESVLSLLFQLAFTPYSVIYMYLLYERLKSLKPEIS